MTTGLYIVFALYLILVIALVYYMSRYYNLKSDMVDLKASLEGMHGAVSRLKKENRDLRNQRIYEQLDYLL